MSQDNSQIPNEPAALPVHDNEKEAAMSQGGLTVPPVGHSTSASTSISGDAALAEKGTTTPPAEGPPRNVSGFLWALVVVSILSSTFLFALDNTIVADVQPAIIERFGNIGKLPWLSVSFLLGAASTNLFWGKIYGLFDVKLLYILTVALFEIGSAVCGAAPTLNALIVGRALAGVGGAGMYVGVLTFLSITTTPHERPTYLGMTGLTWGAGTVLGPVVGGAFADSSATWRWAFYINLVIGGVFAPVYFFLLPRKDPRPGVSLKSKLAEIDYLGTVLCVGAFTSGVMAVSFGGIQYAWKSGQIIGLFVTSGVLFIIFGFQQTYTIFTTEDHRIFPVPFVKSKTMLILFCQTACAITVTFIPVYFIPLFFQFARGDSALDAGVRLLPYVCFLVLFCLLNGGLMSKFGYYLPWYLMGGIFGVIGGALLYTVKLDTSVAAIYGYSILLGVGAGSFCQTSFSVAQVKVAPKDIPMAVGFITCAQVGGATISLAIANSVFLNQSTKSILRLIPNAPVDVVRGAVAGAGSAFFDTLSPALKQQVLEIIVSGISKGYILVLTGGAFAVVLCAGLKFERLFMEMGAAG